MIVMLGTFALAVPLIAAAPAPVPVPAEGNAMATEIVRVGVAGLISLGSGVLTLFVGRREYTVEIAEVKRRVEKLEGDACPREAAAALEQRVTRNEDRLREDVGELHTKINLAAEGLAGAETQLRTLTDLVKAIATKMKIST